MANSSLGDEIVKSFHEQFAQNQNHHQTLFLQVLTVLLTVLVGFGYLYIRVKTGGETKECDVTVTVETIYAFLALSMCLLSLAIALILNMSLGFRRDQLAACNIRVKERVMNCDDNNNYFLSGFNPVGKTNFFTWMPGFHQIFFILLIVVKFLLFFSLVLNSKMSPYFDWHHQEKLITFSIIFFCLSLCADVFFTCKYWNKWKDYSDKAPEILGGKGIPSSKVSESCWKGFVRILPCTIFIIIILAGFTFFLYSIAHAFPEKHYQEQWCQQQRGQAEVVLPDMTRADCITSTHAIEFDFGKKWAEAIGQALYYSLQTGKRAGVVLILDGPQDRKYWIRLNSTIQHFGLPIDTWEMAR